MIDFVKDCGFGETDLELIDKYFKMYGHPKAMPAADYLTTWHEEKSRYLLPIFGNRCIISEEVSYDTPTELISQEIYKRIVGTSEYRSFVRILYEIAEIVAFSVSRYEIWGWHSQMSCDERENYKPGDRLFSAIYGLFENTYDLSNNKITVNGHPDSKYTISLKPSPYNRLKRPFSLRPNQKPFRLMGTIIKEWWDIAAGADPETFTPALKEQSLKTLEKFRIIQSQILNTAKLKGTLCLSIHPMDYITASDNNCDWHSCMTWTRDGSPGEYRVGTLEMMNSKCVVVAYLDSSSPYYPCGGSNREWHNKKWREFFIVDRNFICGIKGYPYQADELEEIVIKKLSEMCEAYGWPKYNRELRRDDQPLNIKGYYVSLSTDIMYNDTLYHEVSYVRSTKPDVSMLSSYYTYSGVAMCLVCGKPITEDTIAKEDDSDRPYCDECAEECRCAECYGYLTFVPGCYHEIDGKLYCMDCVRSCAICGKPCSNSSDNMVTIMSTCNSDSRITHRYGRYMCEHCRAHLKDHLMLVNVSSDEELVDRWSSSVFLTVRPTMPEHIIDSLRSSRGGMSICGTVCDLSNFIVT